MIEQGRPSSGRTTERSSTAWAGCCCAQGDINAAVATLERAVELEPQDATINGHLGDAYWAAGRKLEAHYQWRRALTLNPEPDDAAKLEAKLNQQASSRAAISGAVTRRGAGLAQRVRAGQGQSVPACRRPAGRRLSPARQPGGVSAGGRPAARGAAAGVSLTVDGAVRRRPGGRGGQPGAARGARLLARGRPARADACWRSICRWPPASAAARPMRRRRCGCCAGCGACRRWSRRMHRRRLPRPRLPWRRLRQHRRRPHRGPGADCLTPIALTLGADVPVCLASRPARMGGVGEVLAPAPELPPAGMVLVNPGVSLATPEVFRAPHRRVLRPGGAAGGLAGRGGDGAATWPGCATIWSRRRSRCARRSARCWRRWRPCPAACWRA